MKWLIASDIHGSAKYAAKLFEAYDKEKADRLILLGDLLYHGPRNDLPENYDPKKVINLLNSHKDVITCVRGNCDAEVDQMVLEFPIMADYVLLESPCFLAFVTHGHIYNSEKLPKLNKRYILLHGHTHVPKVVDNKEYVYINPGSVSIPKEGSHHGYIVVEDNRFMFKDLDGNLINEYRYED